jgi:hypothetical protein
VRASLSTLAVGAVVGGVVAAAAVDALTGGSASRPAVTVARPRAGPVIARAVGGIILFGGRIEGARATHGLLVATPAAPPMQVVDVGIRPPRPGDGRIRVVAQRLRLGPGVGTPSGERVAAWAWNPSRPRLDGIYSRPAAGGALGRITSAPGGSLQQPLAYSPDGSLLLYAQSFGNVGAADLYVVRADGTGRVRLTPPGTTSRCCVLGAPGSFGPDGRIAFAAFAPGAAGRRGRSAIYVADADGSPVRRITPTLAWATAARWSPDGRWIAFDQAARPGGAHDLFLVHPGGSGLHLVPTVAGGTASCCPEWSPDSRSLEYAGGRSVRDATLRTVRIGG